MRRLAQGTPCARLSAYLTSEAFQHAQFWLSRNVQMQALLDFNSKDREVGFIIGESSIVQTNWLKLRVNEKVHRTLQGPVLPLVMPPRTPI